MADFDAESFADRAVLIGLLAPAQVREARDDAEDGSLEALVRSLMRKGLLTSWQRDWLLKDDPTGFFYGGCKVLFHIAEGTFARVYRGVEVSGQRPVAVKVLRRRFTSDAEAVKRFSQEAEAGMKLDHPNIVRIHDYGEQDGSSFMVMEYVEGMNLRNFLRLRHRLEAHEALPMMLRLADALNHSLGQGITHRDIKATNVLISNKGEAKLVDFGLATIEGDERKLRQAHGVRTVDYSALERTCGSPKGDPRSDIYFLGCVFYQMLTGQPPMPETDAGDPLTKMLKRSFGAIRPIAEHPHAPPEPIARVVEKMMKVDLKQRYQSMEEVLADLTTSRGDPAAPAAAKRPARPRPGPEPAGAHPDAIGPAPSEVPALVPKNILCIEVQEPIQEALRKALTKMGFHVLLARDPGRAAERCREAPPDLLIFDADGLGPGAIDTFRALHEQARRDGQDLSALVLLGPKQAALQPRIPADDRVLVLVKPIKMRDVQEALAQLVPTA